MHPKLMKRFSVAALLIGVGFWRSAPSFRGEGSPECGS
jgi:hypothetical protein